MRGVFVRSFAGSVWFGLVRFGSVWFGLFWCVSLCGLLLSFISLEVALYALGVLFVCLGSLS